MGKSSGVDLPAAYGTPSVCLTLHEVSEPDLPSVPDTRQVIDALLAPGYARMPFRVPGTTVPSDHGDRRGWQVRLDAHGVFRLWSAALHVRTLDALRSTLVLVREALDMDARAHLRTWNTWSRSPGSSRIQAIPPVLDESHGMASRTPKRAWPNCSRLASSSSVMSTIQHSRWTPMQRSNRSQAYASSAPD